MSFNLKLADDSRPCLEIYAPEMFADEAFVSWLKGFGGGNPTDVFIVIDNGERNESANGMPQHCWDAIVEFCDRENCPYALVRLINAEERCLR
jgi:hypothetical protein